MELTRSFTAEQYQRALASWQWTGVAGKEPLFTSQFGDMFFEDAEGFWYLDFVEGTLTKEWDDLATLRAVLSTEQGQDRYLLGGLAMAAMTRGQLTPTRNQVLCFKVPPIIGGPFTVENIGLTDFVVIADITGQLHDQVRKLPPGAKISGFTVDGTAP